MERDRKADHRTVPEALASPAEVRAIQSGRAAHARGRRQRWEGRQRRGDMEMEPGWTLMPAGQV
ncbi:MAG: hypothetical protein A2X51_15120 [Candidatus Rokubacteria bacterium GWC2_70_24]|nr:MAG: hypothetical protein A2X53_14885 [Candidatus Rokubacteria bacterium GWA2_70_23]OGK88644.1 MAG: hypothetical protein A2X51_15120 [Candidatus Rokubacteria bacterium GWC2_70_24]OGK90943.1 MAG: hypothetical protein A2X50_14075 [Candidatus Rokubacteria bacterium GWF2_70_14]